MFLILNFLHNLKANKERIYLKFNKNKNKFNLKFFYPWLPETTQTNSIRLLGRFGSNFTKFFCYNFKLL